MSIFAISSTAMCQHPDTAECKILEIPTWLPQNTAILMYCCIWHLPYEQHVKVLILVFSIRQCRLNWIMLYSVDITQQLLLMSFFYNDSISQDCKLYLISKHVTLSCLYLLSSEYLCDKQYRYVSTPWHCRVQSIGNSNMTPTKCCYFNVLLYLTSSLWTARQSTYSPIYNKNTYNWPTLPVGTINFMVLASHPCPFICRSYEKKSLWAPFPICKLKIREISLDIARYQT